jgi:protoporphyrinogen oxidase
MNICRKLDSITAIIGGGPAGLTAAYVLSKSHPQFRPIVFEASDFVGGIARTENHNGFRFDIGGHRFFTKVPEVRALWYEICGEEFLTRPRLSRIYYRGKYYDYPLKLWNALRNLGPLEAARILLSYAKWQLLPHRTEESFEQWVINRFGGRLYWHFFRTYTEKVWGIPCTAIMADWAAQRINNLSLRKAIWNAISGTNDTASLIGRFEYPRLGPGMMWEKCRDLISEQGGEVRLNARVTRFNRNGNRIESIEITQPQGSQRVYADEFISTMALTDLIACIEPQPPEQVRAAAKNLKYRDFVVVALILDRPDPFPDNWIYVHSGDVKVGRIQNFRAWSQDMVPDPGKSSVGLEYFCHLGDGLWTSSDEKLISLAAVELELLGLASQSSVIDGVVIRQEKAYPVYDVGYSESVGIIKAWLETLNNFQTVGRNGLHRYNNQDHSMLTAMLAVRNLIGEHHDVWNVNVERSYHEAFEIPAAPQVTTVHQLDVTA